MTKPVTAAYFLIAILLFAFVFPARAQMETQADEGAANETTASAPANALQSRKRLKKENESNWSMTYFTEVGFHRVDSKSGHNTEMDISYAITPITFLGLWGCYSGPLHPTESAQADVCDPQPYLAFEAPLKGSLKRFVFTSSVAAIIPASRASREAEMIGGASLGLGFKWKRGRWFAKHDNFVYLYGYKEDPPDSPTVTQASIDGDSDDDSSDAKDPGPDSPVYVATEHILRFGYKITKQVVWGNKWKYDTSTKGEGNPDQNLAFATKLGFKWTPNIETYAGVNTAGKIGDEKAPPLFSSKTVLGFIGLFMSI